jgi:transcriptional regulator with PAS, ATPase and Fis domain
MSLAHGDPFMRAAVVREEKTFRLIVEAAPNTIVVIDETGEIVIVNFRHQQLALTPITKLDAIATETQRCARPSRECRRCCDQRVATMSVYDVFMNSINARIRHDQPAPRCCPTHRIEEKKAPLIGQVSYDEHNTKVGPSC